MKILVVDDEIVSRTKLTLIMEHFGDCDVVDNGQDALALFRAAHHQEDPFELIMLDINMPVMDGIAVLSEIRDVEKNLKLKKNEAAKILMATSCRDKDQIIACVQSGCNDYIGKPFDIDIIRKKLDKLGIKEQSKRVDTPDTQADAPSPSAQFIDSISSIFEKRKINLPTLPGIQVKFREMIIKGAISHQLANLLKIDVAISTELIRLSNSVYCRGLTADKSIEQAISRLGLSATVQLVAELSNREYFSMKTPKYRALIEQFWKHSIASAYAAEIASGLLNLKLAADPFFMGLLHDVGKLALLQIMAEMEQKGKLNGGATKAKLVGTLREYHCQFGAKLLEKWRYSKSYVHSALYHEDVNYEPENEAEKEEDIPPELLVVHFANLLAKSVGHDLNADNVQPIDLENIESTTLLKLNQDQITQTQQAVHKEMEAVEDLL
jgi:HD-like signal output (HDOD) protein/CheY-like chemotaxis protein